MPLSATFLVNLVHTYEKETYTTDLYAAKNDISVLQSAQETFPLVRLLQEVDLPQYQRYPKPKPISTPTSFGQERHYAKDNESWTYRLTRK